MGIYLNPGNKGFWRSIRSDIYVDKTEMIADTNRCLNTREQFICVSRPRRFGKSMTIEMLAAYYSRGCDSAQLFRGCKIEKNNSFLEHLNQYDVIYLNVQQFLSEADSFTMIEYLEQEVLEELREAYGELLKRQDLGLAAAFRKIYAKTGREFIFLIEDRKSVV